MYDNDCNDHDCFRLAGIKEQLVSSESTIPSHNSFFFPETGIFLFGTMVGRPPRPNLDQQHMCSSQLNDFNPTTAAATLFFFHFPRLSAKISVVRVLGQETQCGHEKTTLQNRETKKTHTHNPCPLLP